MMPRDDRDFARLPEEVMLAIDRLCNRFEQTWRAGKPMRVETLLRELETRFRIAGLAELLPLEIEYRRAAEQPVTLDELTKRFPTVQKDWLQRQLDGAVSSTIVEPAFGGVPEVLGDYRILSRLGSGGMGTVYRALHERMGRHVAVKVLRPEIQNNEALRQRFDREVRAAAKLSHPNIVTALDARSHNGVHFLVTELVEGSDLDHHVRQHGPLSVPQAADVILQAASGLAYAHSQGVIHRDIKPANLLMSRDGVVKILDMGLARLESEDHDRNTSGLTDTGVMMGTAAYMPPEQARDTRRADARSDIYSLGCTLHFLLTGRPVYAGVSQVDTILSHVNQPVPSLRQNDPRVPLGLDRLFQQMIAKDPSERIQTAGEVRERLSQLREQGMEGSDSAELCQLLARMSTVNSGGDRTPAPTEFLFADAPPTKSAPFIMKHSRRQPALIRAAGGITLCCVVVVLWWFSGKQPDPIQNSGPQEPPDPVKGPVAVETDLQEPGASFTQPDDPPTETPKTASITSPAASSFRTGALRFDGQSSYIAAFGVVPEPAGAYTIEIIARAERYQTSNLVSWLGPNWMAVYISEDGQLGAARQFENQSDVYGSGYRLSVTEWTHVAATFEGDRLQLFINGNLTEQQSINFELGPTQGGLFLGGVDPRLLPVGQNQRFFPGQIRNFRLSRGVRYHQSFVTPAELTLDANVIALLRMGVDGVPQLVDGQNRPVSCDLINVAGTSSQVP